MSDIRNLFPRYRVFIYGIEVTALVASVRTQWPTGTPMQLTIELADMDNVFTMTRDDMNVLAGIKDQVFQTYLEIWSAYTGAVNDGQLGDVLNIVNDVVDSDADKKKSNVWGLDNNDLLRYSARRTLAKGTQSFPKVQPIAPLTQQIVNAKNLVLADKLTYVYTQSTIDITGQALPQEQFYKYPVYQGKPVFHFGDIVRVAVADPALPSRWYWLHSGSVTDNRVHTSKDNQRIVTITSEGVLKDLRNARVAQMTGAFRSPSVLKAPNPRPGQPNPGNNSTDKQVTKDDNVVPVTGEQLSILTDSVAFSNVLQGLTLFQIIELLIYGNQTILDDLGQAVRKGASPQVLQERFGIPPSQQGGKGTDEAIAAKERQLRGLNLSALSKFKKWKVNQGVQIRILGGPVSEADRQIGEELRYGLADWMKLVDNQITPSDLITMLDTPTPSGGADIDTSNRPLPTGVQEIIDRTIGPVADLIKTAFYRQPGQSEVDDATFDRPATDVAPPPDVPDAPMDEVISRIGTDIQHYPLRQRVLMLLPATLGPLLDRRVIDLDLSGCPASTAEYFDRLALMSQVTDRIDFVLMDTPRGDIVIEMPLYDFEPRHTGPFANLASSDPSRFAASSQQQAAAADSAWQKAIADMQGVAGAQQQPSKGQSATEKPASYEGLLTIYPGDLGDFDLDSSEQDVKTVWVTVPRFLANVARDASQQNRRQVVTALPNLVPLFGFRVEQGDAGGFITTEEAARLFNHIQLNKANADTVNAKASGCLPNFAAWPNRPFLIDAESVVGTTKSVNHTIAWKSDCSTEFNFWHIKLWDGRFVNNDDNSGQRRLFVPFGGVNAQPYNFAYLLGIEKQARDVQSAEQANRAAAQNAAKTKGSKSNGS